MQLDGEESTPASDMTYWHDLLDESKYSLSWLVCMIKEMKSTLGYLVLVDMNA